MGSAGNKGFITPLESALTKNYPVSLLESALTERWGWGPCFPLRNSPLTIRHSQPDSSPLFSHSSELFCVCQKLNPFVFIQIHTLCEKHPGVGVHASDVLGLNPAAISEHPAQLEEPLAGAGIPNAAADEERAPERPGEKAHRPIVLQISPA